MLVEGQWQIHHTCYKSPKSRAFISQFPVFMCELDTLPLHFSLYYVLYIRYENRRGGDATTQCSCKVMCVKLYTLLSQVALQKDSRITTSDGCLLLVLEAIVPIQGYCSDYRIFLAVIILSCRSLDELIEYHAVLYFYFALIIKHLPDWIKNTLFHHADASSFHISRQGFILAVLRTIVVFWS